MEKGKSHFVLVHGGCHGAWCWYKLATLLCSAGHQVLTPDMEAAGINLTPVEELESVSEYSKPLMDLFNSLASDEKVILVGHSFGGFPISLAMEMFPDKISVAVFVTAFMPGPDTASTTLLHEYFIRLDSQRDNKFFYANGVDNPPTSYVFGEEFQALNLYQNCQSEVLTLAKMLIRPNILVADVVLSREKYGLVPRVYIVIDEDKTLKKDFQEWMIEKNPVKELMEIMGADHMVMLSKPQELYACLNYISASYS